MSSSANIAYRPLEHNEQQKVLSLLYSVFNDTPDTFERYYSEKARISDTLAAWDGDKLVSTVHLCRLPMTMRPDNKSGTTKTVLCGGITNVATAIEYRRQGLSRTLLRQIIQKMENEGFHFSLLDTGVPSLYSSVGWEMAESPTVTVTFDEQKSINGNTKCLNWISCFDLTDADLNKLSTIHSKYSRLLSINRSMKYMKEWVLRNWKSDSAMIHLDANDEGYIVLTTQQHDEDYHEKKGEDKDAFVLEWCASNEQTERTLLKTAITEVKWHHTKKAIDFATLPQYIDDMNNFLGQFGTVTFQRSKSTMLRNIGLNDHEFQTVKEMYASGKATYWPADEFWGISTTVCRFRENLA